MKSDVFASFGDEITKIAFFRKISSGFMDVLREGWHGPKEAPFGWMGEGRLLASSYGGRVWQEASSLGGLTRALPVGPKSMMLLGTAAAIPSAMSPQDPSGQGKSRAERFLGLAGGTVGGLVGGVLGARSRVGGLVGGIGGSILGEKAVAKPFAMLRQHRQGMQQPQPQQSVQPAQPAAPRAGMIA